MRCFIFKHAGSATRVEHIKFLERSLAVNIYFLKRAFDYQSAVFDGLTIMIVNPSKTADWQSKTRFKK